MEENLIDGGLMAYKVQEYSDFLDDGTIYLMVNSLVGPEFDEYSGVIDTFIHANNHWVECGYGWGSFFGKLTIEEFIEDFLLSFDITFPNLDDLMELNEENLLCSRTSINGSSYKDSIQLMVDGAMFAHWDFSLDFSDPTANYKGLAPTGTPSMLSCVESIYDEMSTIPCEWIGENETYGVGLTGYLTAPEFEDGDDLGSGKLLVEVIFDYENWEKDLSFGLDSNLYDTVNVQSEDPIAYATAQGGYLRDIGEYEYGGGQISATGFLEDYLDEMAWANVVLERGEDYIYLTSSGMDGVNVGEKYALNIKTRYLEDLETKMIGIQGPNDAYEPWHAQLFHYAPTPWDIKIPKGGFIYGIDEIYFDIPQAGYIMLQGGSFGFVDIDVPIAALKVDFLSIHDMQECDFELFDCQDVFYPVNGSFWSALSYDGLTLGSWLIENEDNGDEYYEAYLQFSLTNLEKIVAIFSWEGWEVFSLAYYDVAKVVFIAPTITPTFQPTPQPTPMPTPQPTPQPTPSSSSTPSPTSTFSPTPQPTPQPSTPSSTFSPTISPTQPVADDDGGDDKNDNEGLSSEETDAVIGGSVGGGVALAAVAGLLYYMKKKNRSTDEIRFLQDGKKKEWSSSELVDSTNDKDDSIKV